MVLFTQRDQYAEKKELDRYEIAYHSFELSTLEGTSALISCLDLVITVDTSIAHLAAAQGKKSGFCCPFNADWRWFINRNDSPWYPQIRLFRQEDLKDWHIPLLTVKNQLIQLHPVPKITSLKTQLEEASRYAQENAHEKAYTIYRNIVINYPDHHDAAKSLALILNIQNHLPEALLYIQRAIVLAPDIALYRRHFGEILCRVGHLQKAMASYHEAIKLEPNCADNYYLLGIIYNYYGQLESAIEYYQKALSYDSNHGLVWNNLGATLEKLGQIDKAKLAYQSAVDKKCKTCRSAK